MHGLAQSASADRRWLVLCVVVVIVTVISVIGRALIPLGLSAVPGDYEIVQSGVLFAIFCALPMTQYLRGHADVSMLTDYFPARVGRDHRVRHGPADARRDGLHPLALRRRHARQVRQPRR